MSDRPHVPGKSTPDLRNGQLKHVELLRHICRGVSRGLPTAENRLGLYSTSEASEYRHESTLTPYHELDLPDDVAELRNLDHFRSEYRLNPNRFAAASGLIRGGVVALAMHSGFTPIEIRQVYSHNNLEVGLYVMARLHELIAQAYIADGGSSLSELGRICRMSFEDTAGTLMHHSPKVSARIEEGLSLIGPDPSREKPIPARLAIVRRQNALPGVRPGSIHHMKVLTTPPIPRTKTPSCHAPDVIMNRKTLDSVAWNRTTRVCVSLDWLFPAMLADA